MEVEFTNKNGRTDSVDLWENRVVTFIDDTGHKAEFYKEDIDKIIAALESFKGT